jgi:tetratricopeptide (TPR) repeat protein
MLSLTLSRKMSLATVILSAVLVCLVQPRLGGGAAASTSIVLAVDYTLEGGPSEDGSNAIETYLEFVLSRMPLGDLQRIGDYNRDCRSVMRVEERPCPFPDFLIQVQIAEREGQFQMSGAVSQNAEPKNSRTLGVTRGQVRDLSEVLGLVTGRIIRIINAATLPTGRPHVVVACVKPASRQTTSQSRGSRHLHGSASGQSQASSYAERLPKLLESQMARDEDRIRVSINNVAKTDCNSPDGLEKIAGIVNAAAVLSGTVYPDDQGGFFIVPYLLIMEAGKGIQLPALPIPAGDAAYEVLVARKLATLTTALIHSSSYAEFVKAIRDGTELDFYLQQAKALLSSSPPNYDAADALLQLAIVKSPAGKEPALLLARSLSERGRFAEATDTVRSAIKHSPDSEELFRELEDIAVRKGDLHEAQLVYQEALKAGMPEEGALLAIARTYLSAQPPEGSPKMALEYALKAASKNPSFFDAYSLAGQISEAEHDFKSAEIYYQKALSVAPDSSEILSRLSSLYGSWANEDSRAARPDLAIEHLSKSIDIGPAIRKYFDRAGVYLDYYGRSTDRMERARGYELASVDFRAAYKIASRGDKMILTQFPWLLPNLMETLIFEGKFSEAKDRGRELFGALADESNIRSSTDPNDIRAIAAFLNATAEILDVGLAEKEYYLFKNSLGVNQPDTLPWNFSLMLSYLKNDYPTIKLQIEPSDRQARIEMVRRWIHDDFRKSVAD